MTREQAARLCDEINDLDIEAVADVEETDDGFAVIVRNEITKKHMGFADDLQHGRELAGRFCALAASQYSN